MSATTTIRLERLARPCALVLSGGGAQGAAQAGAVVELVEAGLRPDLVVGTSVGAWNGSWLARDPSPGAVRGLVPLWLDPQLRRLFRGLRRGFVGALARREAAALGDTPVRRLLERTCGSVRFDELRVPLAVSAIDVLTAELLYLDSGSVADAVRAASAIPAVLPPVRLGGRLLVDAGFVDNFGVGEAMRRGARSVLLVDASVGSIGRSPSTIPSLLDRANLVTRIHQRAQALRAAAAEGVCVEVVEVAGQGAVLDFRAAAVQIAFGRGVARRRLGIVDPDAAAATAPASGIEAAPVLRVAGGVAALPSATAL